jgi:hypothetical protein
MRKIIRTGFCILFINVLFCKTTFAIHSVLFGVYNQPQLYDWLFAHTTVVPEPATVSLVCCMCFSLAACAGRKR